MLGLSLKLSAQNDEALDQVELLKQFIGTWKIEIGQDTVITIEFSQAGEGIFNKQENKAKGKTYSTGYGLMGFSEDKQFIITTDLWPSGFISQDIGKFVSPHKYVFERFPINQKHSWIFVEVEFKSESIIWRQKSRRTEMAWPDEWTQEITIEKIK
jgi:hypothetical protein